MAAHVLGSLRSLEGRQGYDDRAGLFELEAERHHHQNLIRGEGCGVAGPYLGLYSCLLA